MKTLNDYARAYSHFETSKYGISFYKNDKCENPNCECEVQYAGTPWHNFMGVSTEMATALLKAEGLTLVECPNEPDYNENDDPCCHSCRTSLY
jgi:hypothetical protein